MIEQYRTVLASGGGFLLGTLTALVPQTLLPPLTLDALSRDGVIHLTHSMAIQSSEQAMVLAQLGTVGMLLCILAWALLLIPHAFRPNTGTSKSRYKKPKPKPQGRASRFACLTLLVAGISMWMASVATVAAFFIVHYVRA